MKEMKRYEGKYRQCFKKSWSIISNLRLLIENHKGIKLYTEKEIIVKCKKFNIEISGSELFIREITDEYIYIFGIVENIKYSMWEWLILLINCGNI